MLCLVSFLLFFFSRDGWRNVGRHAEGGLHHRADSVLLRERPADIQRHHRLWKLHQVQGCTNTESTTEDSQSKWFSCIYKTQMKPLEAGLRKAVKIHMPWRWSQVTSVDHRIGMWHATVQVCVRVRTYICVRVRTHGNFKAPSCRLMECLPACRAAFLHISRAHVSF